MFHDPGEEAPQDGGDRPPGVGWTTTSGVEDQVIAARLQHYLQEAQEEVVAGASKEETAPGYDLPLHPPEVYSNQVKPWLATRKEDILYWVNGQEPRVLEKAEKFMSITVLFS